MTLIEVTVSGTVGKQVVATNKQICLGGLTLTPSGANASIKIRDGNASGEVVFYATCPSAGKQSLVVSEIEHKFTKGMHVKVLGAGNAAYLVIK